MICFRYLEQQTVWFSTSSFQRESLRTLLKVPKTHGENNDSLVLVEIHRTPISLERYFCFQVSHSRPPAGMQKPFKLQLLVGIIRAFGGSVIGPSHISGSYLSTQNARECLIGYFKICSSNEKFSLLQRKSQVEFFPLFSLFSFVQRGKLTRFDTGIQKISLDPEIAG